MRPITSLFAAAIISLTPALVLAADETPKPMSDAEKAAVEQVVRDLLTKKEPDLVMKALQEAQNRKQEEENNKSKAALTTSKDRIFNDATSPVVGNPKGDVTIVEFFDYQCGYCKMAHETVIKLIGADKNVKVIYKEFPILGPNSTVAAKAAFAAAKQGKYEKFHNILIAKKDHLSDDVINAAAKEAGVDVEKMRKDMNDADIEKTVQANLALGSDIGVRGTPMFIIGDQTFPGAIQFEQMQQAVADARKKK